MLLVRRFGCVVNKNLIRRRDRAAHSGGRVLVSTSSASAPSLLRCYQHGSTAQEGQSSMPAHSRPSAVWWHHVARPGAAAAAAAQRSPPTTPLGFRGDHRPTSRWFPLITSYSHTRRPEGETAAAVSKEPRRSSPPEVPHVLKSREPWRLKYLHVLKSMGTSCPSYLVP